MSEEPIKQIQNIMIQALCEISAVGEVQPETIHEAQVIRYSQWAIDIANKAIADIEGVV